MEPPASRVLRFGVFEVDLVARELRKRGVRLRLQDQPFRVLEALLEKPGEIVTREELKDRLWAQNEFVEFDKSLNTAVQKIRDALDDSATSPRFLETIPRTGYRFIADVRPVRREAEASDDQGRPDPPRWPKIVAVAAALAVVALVAKEFWSDNRASPPAPTSLQRLTSDSGLTVDPAISADGALVAYASDRDSSGGLDVWVQQVRGGGAVRLTDDPADDRYPSFSPDGTTIAFESRREQDGVYLVASLGGEPRLLIPGGRRPRFSPDGSWLSFHIGYQVWIVSPSGGEPKELREGLIVSRDEVLWTADSQYLICSGNLEGQWDWWAVEIESAVAAPMGFAAILEAHDLRRASDMGYQIPPGPEALGFPRGDRILRGARFDAKPVANPRSRRGLEAQRARRASNARRGGRGPSLDCGRWDNGVQQPFRQPGRLVRGRRPQRSDGNR